MDGRISVATIDELPLDDGAVDSARGLFLSHLREARAWRYWRGNPPESDDADAAAAHGRRGRGVVLDDAAFEDAWQLVKPVCGGNPQGLRRAASALEAEMDKHGPLPLPPDRIMKGAHGVSHKNFRAHVTSRAISCFI